MYKTYPKTQHEGMNGGGQITGQGDNLHWNNEADITFPTNNFDINSQICYPQVTLESPQIMYSSLC